MSNKEDNLTVCPICKQQFFKRGFNAHIKKFHSGFTDKEKISLWLRCFHQDMFAPVKYQFVLVINKNMNNYNK